MRAKQNSCTWWQTRTLVCNFAVLHPRIAHKRFRSICMHWMLLSLDIIAALLIADCISNFSWLPLYWSVFYLTNSQAKLVHCLHFLRDRWQKRRTDYKWTKSCLNRWACAKYAEIQLPWTTLRLSSRMGNLFKTKFGDFALSIYKFFFVAV